MLQNLRGMLFRWKSTQMSRSLSSAIPGMVKGCPELIVKASADDWKIEKIFPSLGDMTVMIISPGDASISAILYLPGSDRAIADFERRKRVMVDLFEDRRISYLWRYLPKLLCEGTYKDRPYWVTTRLPGLSSENALHGNDVQSVLLMAADVLGYLHQKTTNSTIVGEDLLARWVFLPIKTILQSPLAYYHRKSRLLLEELERKLSDAIRGKRVVITRIHGDYWPNNILISSDHKEITGIVDWDLADPNDLPSMDVINFLLSSSREIQGLELGELIVQILKNGKWEYAMQKIWDDEAQLLGIKDPNLEDSLLIFWIRHLSANLIKSRWYSMNPLWAINNYQRIMNYLETGI